MPDEAREEKKPTEPKEEKKPEEKSEKRPPRKDDDTVYVPAYRRDGQDKDDAVYENAIITLFKRGIKRPKMKARGNAIGRAANIAAKMENRKWLKILQSATRITTEEMEGGKNTTSVSIEVEETK